MTDETNPPEGAAAPAETEVKPEVTETEAKAENTGEEAAPEKPEETTDDKPKKGFQKRINQLTRSVRELERALETERLSRQVAEPKETKGEPNISDYDDLGKYAKDVAKWEVNQAKTEFSKSQSEEVHRVLIIKAQEEFKDRMDSYAESHDDFHELVEEIGPMIRGAALDSLIESKHGPEIIHHLAKNPEEAEKLSRLSPNAAAREIGRIEERLSTKQVKKTTSAPAPVKTVTGSSPVSTKIEDINDMRDFIKAHRAGKKFGS